MSGEIVRFILLSLVAFRVWKLVGNDVIADRPRMWLVGWSMQGIKRKYLEMLLGCPWCAGSWVTFAVFAAADLAFGVSLTWPVAQAVAAATVVGLLGDVQGALSEDH